MTHLIANMSYDHAPKGKVIYSQEAKINRKFYIVLSGEVALARNSMGGFSDVISPISFSQSPMERQSFSAFSKEKQRSNLLKRPTPVLASTPTTPSRHTSHKVSRMGLKNTATISAIQSGSTQDKTPKGQINEALE